MDFETMEQLDAQTKSIRSVSESFRNIKKVFNQRELARQNEQIKESFRIDLTDKSKFDLGSPFFSIKGFRESVHRMVREGRVRETNPETAFSALFRALVNNTANNWYELQPTVYEEFVQVMPSSHAVEPYAPMHRQGTPRRTEPGVPSPEVGMKGPMDIQIKNAKFTAITSVPEELIMWDQTAQVQQRIQDIGPNMAQYEDAYAAIRFIGAAGTVFGDTVVASATKPSVETSATWPWSTAFLGGGANILSAYATFTQDVVQKLDNLLYQQKDMNGNYLVVNADTLLIGSGLRFPAATLMNSTFYPATAAQNVAVSSGAGTSIGTSYAENVMKGLYRPITSRYLPQKAWAIGMAHKGMIQQVASGLSVVQENPQAGDSFNQGEYRFKAKKFWEMDWIEPRFWGLGNDGNT